MNHNFARRFLKPAKKKKQELREGAVNRVSPAMPPPPSHTDVLGSYTGRPENGEIPVQDADDL